MFKLIIGNRAYSSWSMRGWLACKASGEEFEELVVPILVPRSAANVWRYVQYEVFVSEMLTIGITRHVGVECEGRRHGCTA